MLDLMLAMLVVTAPPQQPVEIYRSPAEVRAFKKTHPCPSTGFKYASACPGYVVDHIIPLCAGGPDKPSNMQWQEYAVSLKKDVEERRYCRVLRKKSYTIEHQ